MIDPEKIYHEVLSCGEDFADKKAAYEALDENTKSVLADITSRYLDGKTAHATATTLALASRDYKEHLAEVSKARRAYLVAQVRYDALKMLSELRRSEESTRRAEMGLR